MSRKKVILFYLNYSTFVKEDDQILTSEFSVRKYRFEASKKPLMFFFEIFKLLFYSILHIPFNDVVYIWFADYHSLLPAFIAKIFRKKVVIVIGGYDAVSIPSINFGVFRKRNFRAFCARKSLQMADLILPVDESLVQGFNLYADPENKGYQIGIAHFVSPISGKIVVVPTGYDPEKWHIIPDTKREKSVITIGGAPDMQTFRRKGLDLLIEAARLMPETMFYIVGLKGKMNDYALQIAPKNVHSLGYLPNDELPLLLNQHKVFAQFSMSEGLPNTLCEAMLCGCIPVGSQVNGIPKGIGQTGYILDSKNAEKACQLLKKALDSPTGMSEKARAHILQHFLLAFRKEKIVSLVRSL